MQKYRVMIGSGIVIADDLKSLQYAQEIVKNCHRSTDARIGLVPSIWDHERNGWTKADRDKMDR